MYKSRDCSQQGALPHLVLTTGESAGRVQDKGTRTPNHKPICKDLADKKVLNYIQLEDIKDKPFLKRNTFPSAHAKSLANGGLSVAAVNSDAQKVFDTVQNYISATKRPICTHTEKYNVLPVTEKIPTGTSH